MKKKDLAYYFCFFVFTILISINVYAQEISAIDSLKKILIFSKTDTSRVYTLDALAEEYTGELNDSAIYFANRALLLASKINFKKGIALSYLNLGWAYEEKTNYSKAHGYYFKNLALNWELKNYKAIAEALRLIGGIYSALSNYPKALEYYFKSLKVSNEINDKKGIALTYNCIGGVYSYRSNYPMTIEYLFLSIKVNEAIGDKEQVALNYHNLGYIYNEMGNYADALISHKASLNLYSKIDDTLGIILSYNNIGLVFKQYKDYESALKNHFKALKMAKAIDNSYDIARTNTYIGNVLCQQNKYTSALQNYSEAIKILTQLEDKTFLSITYENYASAYEQLGNFNEAIRNQFIALEIRQQIGNKAFIAASFLSIARLYLKMQHEIEAQHFLNKCINLSMDIGSLEYLKNAYKSLAFLDSSKGDFKSAFENYMKFIIYRDSLFNNENTKKITKQQMQYDFDKKQTLSIAEQEKKDALTKKEIEKQRLVRNSFIGGFILVMLIAIGIFRSLQQNRKAKAIITHQKELVEEKNKEILDSIEYAKRLQNAILPANKLVKEYLVDSFILYKPKDIVAGDFYWFYPVQTESASNQPINKSTNQSIKKSTNQLILFAAADCTGHGVPGAMVSVVCANALNKAVKELNLKDPGKILDAVNNFVEETFEKKDEEDIVQDGMDISLCALNLDTLQLQWSGANNPLILIQNEEFRMQNSSNQQINNSENQQLIELKPDKQPIGLYSDRKPFTTHTLQLQKGDMLYLFSDGFADQFGGTEGKKLMKKNLKNHLLHLAALPIDKQLSELELYFNTWKGLYPQVDDVCVIGVRV